MNLVNGLFVDPAAERALTTTYHRFIDQEADFEQMVLAAKQQILRYSLNSELHVLGHEFHRLAQQSWTTRDFTLTGLREALADIITRFPVYRTYITEEGVQPEDRRDLDWAVSCGAQGDRAGRSHGAGLPACRAVDRSGRHARLRARRRDRHGDALSADHRPGDGEVARGHRLLPLPPAGLAERGRRRAGPVRHQPFGVPSPDAPAAAAPACLDAGERHPRPQARRGRAGAHQRAERAAGRMAAPGQPLGAAEPLEAPRARWPARAGS